MLIFGNGEFARLMATYIEYPCRLTVHKQYVQSDEIPFENALPHEGLLIAVGYRHREKVFEEAIINRGFPFAGWQHPSATIGDRFSGCLFFEQVNVQPTAYVGGNTVIWSQSHIGHHAHIGMHCFITSHVCIAGGAKIGQRCFIGCGAIINDHITIGDDVIVQAGAVVDRDVPSGSVWTREGLSKVPSSKVKL